MTATLTPLRLSKPFWETRVNCVEKSNAGNCSVVSGPSVFKIVTMSAVSTNRSPYLSEHVASLAQAANAAASMAADSYEYYFGLNSPVKPDVDPAPHQFYERIYSYVRHCTPYVIREQREEFLKAYEYTAESRANYLIIKEKYQYVYHNLQDARAFHTIMVEKKAEVEKALLTMEGKEGMELATKKKRTELEAIDLQIQRNAREVPDLLSRTQELAARRDKINSEFLALKKKLNDEKLPELFYMIRQIAQKRRSLHKDGAVNGTQSTQYLSDRFRLLTRP